jgi:hypothetical protein
LVLRFLFMAGLLRRRSAQIGRFGDHPLKLAGSPSICSNWPLLRRSARTSGERRSAAAPQSVRGSAVD